MHGTLRQCFYELYTVVSPYLMLIILCITHSGTPKFLDYSDWTEKEEDADDVNVWEDNWDDDNVEDDFSQQLRYFL